MKAIVFAGPSIPRGEVASLEGVEWRPPVSQGDVFRAAQQAPRAIAIIDGYFEGVPSVWHKELLWAMARGVHVFGAASMGALRAAELHRYGMRGVGVIFERYLDGTYEDDDEVAVLHAPEELDYAPLTVPMVNVRVTVEAAVEASVVNASDGEIILESAKSIFFQRRRWNDVLEAAASAGAERRMLAEFDRWLPAGERDQKRLDARRLLDELASFLASDPAPMHCGFSFEWTVMWDSVATGMTGLADPGVQSERDGIEDLVLDELRQSPALYEKLSLRTRLKQLALGEAGRRRVDANLAQISAELQRLRETFGLYTRAQLVAWLDRNDWSPGRLERAVENRQREKVVSDRLPDDDQMMLDELRLDGAYEKLKERALAKRTAVRSLPDEPDIAPAQLLAWYFESHLGGSVPDDFDGYLSEIGIHQREDFYRMAKREYLFGLAMACKSP